MHSCSYLIWVYFCTHRSTGHVHGLAHTLLNFMQCPEYSSHSCKSSDIDLHKMTIVEPFHLVILAQLDCNPLLTAHRC